MRWLWIGIWFWAVFLSGVWGANPPAVLDFNINDNNTWTSQAEVTLSIYSLDANKMNFSCDGNNFGV
jgi:hypothetical protein